MKSGVERAWEILRGLDPQDVCRRAPALFDPASGQYVIRSFGADFRVLIRDERLQSDAPPGEVLLGKLNYFFELSLLCYLNTAKDIPASGKLIKPVHMRGGELFFRGTHVLPLDRLAGQYDGGSGRFLEKGISLGGEPAQYGDAAIRLYPFPRIPVTLVLWSGDEEFPPRSELLFDSSCEFHVPVDIIWSIAMMSILMMS